MPNYRKLLGDGKCANPHCKSPRKALGSLFRRVRIDLGVINVQAARSLMGLSMHLGSPALAEIFDPTPADEHVIFSAEPGKGRDKVLHTYLVCQACYIELLPPWLLEGSRSVESLSEDTHADEIADYEAGHPGVKK